MIERFVRAKWHVIEKLQEDAPVAGFCRRDQQSQQTCTSRDSPGPRQSIAHQREQIGQRRTARRCGGGDRLRRLLPGKTHGKQSVQPKYDAGCRQDREKHRGLGADAGQEHRSITDRGKPQPIDQHVAREPEQDQANAADDGRNNELHHGVLPWRLPSGCGDPDRHGPDDSGNEGRLPLDSWSVPEVWRPPVSTMGIPTHVLQAAKG